MNRKLDTSCKDWRYRKTALATACSNFNKLLYPPGIKHPFCLCVLVWREVEQVVSPTAGLNISPGGSTRRKFQIDTGEECIPEERQGWWMTQMKASNPFNAIPRKDSSRTIGADHGFLHDPPSHEGPCAGKQAKNIFISSATTNGTCLLLKQVCFISVGYPRTPCRNSTEEHDATWCIGATLDGTLQARNKQATSSVTPWHESMWNISSWSYRREKVQGKKQSNAWTYIIVLCCELCFDCLTVFSLSYCTPFPQKLNHGTLTRTCWALHSYKLPFTTETSVHLERVENLFWLNLHLARPEDQSAEPTTTTESSSQSSRRIILEQCFQLSHETLYQPTMSCQVQQQKHTQKQRWTQTATLLPAQMTGRNDYKHQICNGQSSSVPNIDGNDFNSLRFQTGLIS